MQTKWKSRKFIVIVSSLAVTAVFLWFGKLSGAEYVGLFQWLFGIYVFGNVGQKGVEKIKNNKE